MTAPASNSPVCSLTDPRVRAVLERLHAQAGTQTLGVARMVLSALGNWIRGRPRSLTDEIESLRNLYVPVTRKQGQLLYLIARAMRATRVVEFGTSFGVSTTYLAAAMRDNGGGIVVGTELVPEKIAAARRNLNEAGLAEFVDIREGDAHETLKNTGGPVDMVLLDGYLPLYLPILQQLTPVLRQGASVLAVNIVTFRLALAAYLAYVREPSNGFLSVTLFVGDGVEYSIRL